VDAADRVFLEDYLEFGYLGHVAAAVALYRAAMEADETASRVHLLVDLLPGDAQRTQEEARVMAERLATSGRVETALLAKLYAEYVATIEDFGAMLHAVRERRAGGLLCQYVNCREEVAEVLRLALKTEPLRLPRFLNLPHYDDLRDRLPPDVLEDVSRDLDVLAGGILDVANMYTATVGNDRPADLPLSDEWRNHMWIVLRYGRGSPGQIRPIRLVAESYNKIKHRFLVIENMKALVGAVHDKDTLVYAYQAKDRGLLEALVNSVAGVVTRQMELGAMLLTLDDRDLL